MDAARAEKPDDADAWRAAERYGVDMSLLRHRLSLTSQQRFRLHLKALRRVRRLRHARSVP